MGHFKNAGFDSSENRYELLPNKYRQDLERWCCFCGGETSHGMWEDDKPRDLIHGGFGEFFCQCKTCGSFTEWIDHGSIDFPKVPGYAVQFK